MKTTIGGAMDAADEEENVDAVGGEIKEKMKKKKLLNLQVYLIILEMTQHFSLQKS